ncbi:MAG TPA: PP2C family protein-serine/threonine phosphatase, partial [Solirubrobacteraceae bacterium]|nr:PP2C family protein-serine/threonine phosphatase [Solirubrobacteraceae bacterium]
HPSPLRLGEHGVAEVGEHGTLLGALARTRWPETNLELRPGETLVAFTDGVTDTVGEDGERWGSARLQQVLAGTRSLAAPAIKELVVTALDEFQVGAQADDTALVIMRFTGKSSAQGRSGQLSGVGARLNG